MFFLNELAAGMTFTVILFPLALTWLWTSFGFNFRISSNLSRVSFCCLLKLSFLTLMSKQLYGVQGSVAFSHNLLQGEVIRISLFSQEVQTEKYSIISMFNPLQRNHQLFYLLSRTDRFCCIYFTWTISHFMLYNLSIAASAHQAWTNIQIPCFLTGQTSSANTEVILLWIWATFYSLNDLNCFMEMSSHMVLSFCFKWRVGLTNRRQRLNNSLWKTSWILALKRETVMYWQKYGTHIHIQTVALYVFKKMCYQNLRSK